jgi:hypothetical protein
MKTLYGCICFLNLISTVLQVHPTGSRCIDDFEPSYMAQGEEQSGY